MDNFLLGVGEGGTQQQRNIFIYFFIIFIHMAINESVKVTLP